MAARNGLRTTHSGPAEWPENAADPLADTQGAEADRAPAAASAADLGFAALAPPQGERIGAVDYFAIIQKAVADLGPSTAEARHTVYECARQVVTHRLNSFVPPLPADLIEVERASLDLVISKIEANARARQARAEPEPAGERTAAPLAPVLVGSPQTLPQAGQFHGGTLRVLGAAAIVIAGLVAYWVTFGKPKLPANPSPGQHASQTPAQSGERAAFSLGAPAALSAAEMAAAARALEDGDAAKQPYWMAYSNNFDTATSLAREDARSPEASRVAEPPAPANAAQDDRVQAAAALANRDLDGAVRQLTETIRLEPQNAAAYLERGQALFRRGETERAIADFQSATRIDPLNARAFKALGMAVHYIGDTEGAIANLSRAIDIARLNPYRLYAIDVFYARRVRASLYASKRQVDLELADLSAIIEDYWKKPTLVADIKANYGEPGAAGVMAQIYRARAANFVARRNYDAAAADLSMAFQIDPRQTLALTIERARIHELAGRRAQAVADFRRALELSPNNTDVKSALARLRGN
jgi:tetratricopeptide (TPR) repeat protein